MSDSSIRQLSVCPILQFPSEAEPGKTYLLTIDLRPQQGWPYQNDEEVTVYCLLDTAPLFRHEPLGEPAVVLHRYGGSYGPARFLLTAGTETREGIIQVTLVSGRGVPMSVFETPVIQVREQPTRRLVNSIAEDIYPHVEKTPSVRSEFAPLSTEKVFLSNLPVSGKELFGRNEEMKRLDEAWDDPSTNIISLVALGGVGKSALVNHWLRSMAQDNYRGASRVYAWSFYEESSADPLPAPTALEASERVDKAQPKSIDFTDSITDDFRDELHRRYVLEKKPQQPDEWVLDKEFEFLLLAANQQSISSRDASSDQFIEDALAWFGAADPHAGSAWVKGERLAHLIGAQRTLLVLDGLERLQSPPNLDDGRLKDAGLLGLLRQLATSNEGLCIITTREAVADLAPFEAPHVRRIDLENLSPEAGAELLKAQGVKGTQAELEQASRKFDGHALALTLLGQSLSKNHDGELSHIETFKGLDDAESTGLDIPLAIESYEKQFGEGSELAVLRMLALFNRAADNDALAALRAAPTIEGLTEPLQGLSATEWQRVLATLHGAGLLNEPNSNLPGAVEINPLVREHFRQHLKLKRPAAWRAGNNRLYEHFQSTVKELPDTLEEMSPLFEAVEYGCQAGRYQDAFEMYWRRILHGRQFYHHRKLAAFDLDLATLSNFFDEPWRKVKSELDEPTTNFIFDLVGIDLRARGRLSEALDSLGIGLENWVTHQEWGQAAWTAATFSTTLTLAGELDRAIEVANNSLHFAQMDADGQRDPNSLTALAYALFQTGRYAEAQDAFRQAEKVLKISPTEFSFLNSVSGFHYCELLFETDMHEDAQYQAARFADSAEKGSLLEVALGNLLLGQSSLYNFRYFNYQDARERFDLAMDGLRRSGHLDYLPYALLTRAKLHRLNSEFDRVRADLDEAMDIATRSGMLLYQSDCHLEYSQLYLAQSEREKAIESLNIAKEMVRRLGYHRRDNDIHDVERRLEPNLTSDVQPAEPITIFCSYSHKDQQLWDEMTVHLALLRREALIRDWHDARIEAGEPWADEINRHLNSSQIILLLVSPAFMNSDYLYGVEMKRALERHNLGEAYVIPIILRPTDWEGSPLGELQALPTDGKAVTLWKNHDEAFRDIARGIQKAIEILKSKSAPPTSPSLIPRPPVIGFVSRRDEQGRDIVERLKAGLAPNKNQLITLSGPGGVGKTTLAAEVARTLKEVYRGRVVWSSADGRTDVTLSTLLDEIATQLGQTNLRPLAPEEKAARVHTVVAELPTLIVLDNYETIADESKSSIEQWLTAAQCSALFTSRHRINPTLHVPIMSMSRTEAEEYLERLIAETQDAQIFTDVVRRRIYEAAEANPFVMQWVVAQIDVAQEPDTVLEELAHGEGDAAMVIFDRSFNLPQLGETGRAALLALSLFVPSASREALAEVAGFGSAVLSLNEAVKSLRSLWFIRATDENRRLTVEGLLRSIAGARLSRDARANDFRTRFYTYFQRYAEAHARPTPEDFDALGAEKDNLLAAMDMASAERNWESVQRLAEVLVSSESMLIVRGYWDEAIRVGEQALAAARAENSEWSIARFESYIAGLRVYRGEYAEARRAYQHSLDIFRKLGSNSDVVVALNQLGLIAYHQKELTEARRLYDESLEMEKQLGDAGGIALTLYRLGRLAQEREELTEARRLYEESLEIYKKLGDQSGIANSLHELGGSAHSQGKLTEARRLYEESLEIKKRLGNQNGIAITLFQLGVLAEDEGDKVEAARLFREGLNIFEKLGSPNAELARESLKRVEGEAS